MAQIQFKVGELRSCQLYIAAGKKKREREREHNMKKRKQLCTIGGNVNWYNHYGKQYGVPQKLKIQLPYDPAILLLDIYLKKKKKCLFDIPFSLQHYL